MYIVQSLSVNDPPSSGLAWGVSKRTRAWTPCLCPPRVQPRSRGYSRCSEKRPCCEGFLDKSNHIQPTVRSSSRAVAGTSSVGLRTISSQPNIWRGSTGQPLVQTDGRLIHRIGNFSWFPPHSPSSCVDNAPLRPVILGLNPHSLVQLSPFRTSQAKLCPATQL